MGWREPRGRGESDTLRMTGDVRMALCHRRIPAPPRKSPCSYPSRKDLLKMPAPDFNAFLHQLRTDALRSMPAGAHTFLSAGCAGRWYFDWVAENYPGVRTHVGVEAYSPKPDDLPEGTRWIANSVADMSAVATNSVDLLFSGQNIEHLAPGDITGFLCEAKRVVRPGGWLVIDSPNRAITERLGWLQPEHVLELRVDEIRVMTELAGFDVQSIRGLWPCYDPVRHRLLDLEPAEDPRTNADRAASGEADPDNAFVWWLTARNSDRPAQREALVARVDQVAAEVFPRLATRFRSQIGHIVHDPLHTEASVGPGVQGYLVFGPYAVLFPGRYVACFRLRIPKVPDALAPDGATPVARLDVVSFHRGLVFGSREVLPGDLSRPSADGFALMEIPFELSDTAFGVEFRVFSTGAAALAVALPVTVPPLP
jgi:SAM-dependent methyltransferase